MSSHSSRGHVGKQKETRDASLSSLLVGDAHTAFFAAVFFVVFFGRVFIDLTPVAAVAVDLLTRDRVTGRLVDLAVTGAGVMTCTCVLSGEDGP